jgi:hypothetical protein
MSTTIEAVSHKQSTSMKKAIPCQIIHASHFSIPTKREVGITDLEGSCSYGYTEGIDGSSESGEMLCYNIQNVVGAVQSEYAFSNR